MNTSTPDSSKEQNGTAVVAILFIMMFLSTILFGLMLLAQANMFRAYGRIYLLQAQYAAESGADAAVATLNSGNTTYSGTTSDVTILSNSQYKSTYSTTVANGSDSKTRIVTATGKLYKPATATTASYTRTIRVTVQRTSTTSASGLMSRNIIDVDSSVKNITGAEIYLNGYLNIRSNSTNLYATKISVAGKDTGASNCSIEGSGHLNKNPSLGSGKAIINTAYNNCITPPGNTTNADFTVSALNSSITAITSMYIPWSQYMDGTYQNSPSGCSEWTSGSSSSTVSIPNTGNTKKTHYPNSGSGVLSSCGSSGNLNLQSRTFNIADNVHVRANFCSASACSPTFNNTSGSLKFVFIEGTINFSSFNTCRGVANPIAACTSASAPIVFITYGADPGSHGVNKCPYGDSIYLSKNGSTGTIAPAAYLLAMNSVCLDGTKFDGDPALGGSLGGIGGKNLYIASNSGNPFDLYLDPTFPVSSIPIDLAWRAVGYERL